MTFTKLSFSLPESVESQLAKAVEEWEASASTGRIWRKDAAVWTGSGEDRWLGWLDIAAEELAKLDEYRDLREDVAAADFAEIVLMGMGGSSLGPEVLAMTFGVANFHILDSTVPAQVLAVEERLDLAKTLFIVASKSGTTLEPNCFMRYFFERVSGVVGADAGRQFIAITDTGSQLEAEAKSQNFRKIIYGKPDVGGRFSALSPFGMTPAALMGLDVETILRRAAAMADECRNDRVEENPGALLGLILGVCHAAGRDKLTIFASDELGSLGAWLEQLIAESTGKSGVAIIPIVGEEPQPTVSYGSDRVFVDIRLDGTNGEDVDLSALRAAGHPVLQIEVAEIADIGAEFYRWEFATAVAGAVLGLNPFDQPDVEAAKVETRELTDKFERYGKLPDETAFFESDGISLFASESYAAKLREMLDEPSVTEYLSAHIANIEDGDYFAVLAYLEMNAANTTLLHEVRTRVLERRLAATCLGFGPRFLHSTGQAYKGGPDSGVFLQITADVAGDVPIPGRKYSFGIVKDAQARGDLQVLVDRGRRALRVHLSGDIEEQLERLSKMVQVVWPE